MAREGIKQLGFAARSPLTTYPLNGLDIDAHFIRQYVYDIFVPGMFPGSQAIGVKLTTPATFMVAALTIDKAPPMAFPILQRVYVTDRITAVQQDRAQPRTLVTQALDMTP